jgi:hypothetical protein
MLRSCGWWMSAWCNFLTDHVRSRKQDLRIDGTQCYLCHSLIYHEVITSPSIFMYCGTLIRARIGPEYFASLYIIRPTNHSIGDR